MAKSREAELKSIRDSVAWIGGLSDSLVKIGPFSIGLDGVLAWLPGVGEVYSAGAAAFLLIQGVRAGVSPMVLLASAGMLALRTGVDTVPLAGALAADLFTAHKWSARMIVRAIDKKLGETGPDLTHDRQRTRRRWARFATQG